MLMNPDDNSFKPSFEASGVFALYEGKFPLLKRNSLKDYPLMWGIPSGTVERNESPLETAMRELEEETGIILDANDLYHLKSFSLRLPDKDFIYHTYSANLEKKFPERPRIILSKEHISCRYVLPTQALEQYNLIPDLDICIKFFLNL